MRFLAVVYILAIFNCFLKSSVVKLKIQNIALVLQQDLFFLTLSERRYAGYIATDKTYYFETIGLIKAFSPKGSV